ncbi:MAG: twin-arginine translocase subunit TatC [Alphaproteobacteria bacterium]|nr:twin-arginine translocase subunit TatC [Alphaproteobacteria bacterium]
MVIHDIDNTKQPLLDHLIDLRKRLVYSAIALIVTFVAAFFVAGPIFDFLAKPLYAAFARVGQPDARMIFTGPAEFFFTQVKVAFFSAVCVSFPLIAHQIWMFVAPGLYRKEKLAALPFMVVGPALFLLGASVVYYLFYPLALDFFLTFQEPGGDGQLAIELETRVSEYFSLLLALLLAFGAAFQMPLIITLLAKVGFVDSTQLKEARKYAIVGAFILAAILTPPDPFSQIGLALPLILLYEISILCARVVERKRARAESEESAGDAEEGAGGTVTPAKKPADEFQETDFNQAT